MNKELEKGCGKRYTMEDKCFVCGKVQKVNEIFIVYELTDCHISFCSKKCEEIHNFYLKMCREKIKLKEKSDIKKFKEMIEELILELDDELEEIIERRMEQMEIDYEEARKSLKNFKEYNYVQNNSKRYLLKELLNSLDEKGNHSQHIQNSEKDVGELNPMDCSPVNSVSHTEDKSADTKIKENGE